MSEEKQKCLAEEGARWLEKPWPLSGYFCAKPQPYDCNLTRIHIISAGQVRQDYADKLSQVELDVAMGRRGDYNAVEQDKEYYRDGIKQMREERDKYAHEYLDHGCTKDADKVRALLAP